MTFDYNNLFTAFYQKVNPEKIKDVQDLLMKYKGNEKVLFDRMCLKYGIDSQEFLNSFTLTNQNSYNTNTAKKVRVKLTFLLSVLATVIIYFVLNVYFKTHNSQIENLKEQGEIEQTDSNKINSIEGHYLSYLVITNKSYFYTYPSEDAKRKSYVQKGDEVESTLQEKKNANGWIKVEFTNTAGKITKGYLKISTLQEKDGQ